MLLHASSQNVQLPQGSMLLNQVPDVLSWLKRNCDAASSMQDPDSDDIVQVSSSSSSTDQPTATHYDALQMGTLRKLLFPPGPNAYSHLHLLDFTDVVQRLPDEELQQVCISVVHEHAEVVLCAQKVHEHASLSACCSVRPSFLHPQ